MTIRPQKCSLFIQLEANAVEQIKISQESNSQNELFQSQKGNSY